MAIWGSSLSSLGLSGCNIYHAYYVTGLFTTLHLRAHFLLTATIDINLTDRNSGPEMFCNVPRITQLVDAGVAMGE